MHAKKHSTTLSAFKKEAEKILAPIALATGILFIGTGMFEFFTANKFSALFENLTLPNFVQYFVNQIDKMPQPMKFGSGASLIYLNLRLSKKDYKM